MTISERNNKLKHFINCLKCEVSGKNCDVNCSTQYDAGNMGEIIENLEAISKVLNQQPCEDCVKREDAKKFLYERLDRLNDDELYDIFSKIIDDMYNELPSVTPQPKRGKWEVIRKEYEFMGGIVNEAQGCKCSNCNGIVKLKSDFCPSCGSYNGEVQDND